MKKTIVCVLMLAGCVRNQGGSLLLKDVVAVEPPECNFDVAATFFRSSGTRDVAAVSLAAYGYVAGPRMFNQMQPTAEDPVRVGLRQNVRAEANQLVVRGFNVCYEFPGEIVTPPDRLPECEDLGGSQFLRHDGGVVTVNSNTVVSLDLFPPAISAANSRFTDGLNVVGDRKTVVVHLQVVAFTQDGRQVESNEMLFPVTLCYGCLPQCPFGTSAVAGSICFNGQDRAPECEANAVP